MRQSPHNTTHTSSTANWTQQSWAAPGSSGRIPQQGPCYWASTSAERLWPKMTMTRTWDTTTTTLEKLRATKRTEPHAPWHWNPFPLELEIVPWVLKPVVWCLIPCPCCWNPCPWSRNPPPLELELGPLMLEPVLLLLKPMPLLPEPAPLKLEPAPLKLEPAPPLNLELFVKAIF